MMPTLEQAIPTFNVQTAQQRHAAVVETGEAIQTEDAERVDIRAIENPLESGATRPTRTPQHITYTPAGTLAHEPGAEAVEEDSSEPSSTVLPEQQPEQRASTPQARGRFLMGTAIEKLNHANEFDRGSVINVQA